MVIGDIARAAEEEIRGLDLLNESLRLDVAFGISRAARAVVLFLEQDRVKVKTLEPHFCHAKVYL